MVEGRNRTIRQKQLSYAVSVAIAMMASNFAMAQEAEKEDPKKQKAEVATVLVVGVRQSQRSALEREKNAATAMNSIVAEDVGSFPDRNVGEAISRIAGVALNRGDFGEGVAVSVRGNDADLTRVEIDGQGVQAGGGTDLLGGGEGRGVELREMSSDLIKSVDVVKGSTADMTEGSLGGSIIIKSRTGLDFKKPYYSLRLGASQGSLNKDVTPNLNLVLSNKFMDNRLGVMVNLNKSEYRNESHTLANAGANNRVGLVRPLDFDGSPEKTFTFNPATMRATEPSVDALFANSFFTPRQVVTKSGAAATKDACRTAFPALTAAQTAGMSTNTRNNWINQRSNEQITCLNQWNDYTPSSIRSFVKQQDDRRVSGDLRLDFKVNNQLTVFAKYNQGSRTVTDIVSNTQLGGIATNQNFTDSASNVRTAVAGSGFYTFPDSVAFKGGSMPTSGATANIKPGYVVDANHHVTQYTTTGGNQNTDMIRSPIETSSKYFSTGGEYRNGAFKAEFFVGKAKSDMLRHDVRANVSYNYGEATYTVLRDGAWAFDLPNSKGQLDYAAYSKLTPQGASNAVPISASNSVFVPAYTAAQRPLMTTSTRVWTIRTIKRESDENTAKADMSYSLPDAIPFFNRIKGGFNFRDTSVSSWGNGGGTVSEPVGTFGTPGYVPGVYLQSLNLSSWVVGCEPTATSSAPGGQPCNYGVNKSTDPRFPWGTTKVVTQAEYQDIIAQSLSLPPNGQFFGGAKNRDPRLSNGWNQINIDKLSALAEARQHLDCIVSCVANDGKVYDQPISRYKERSLAAYFMADFDLDTLPFSKRPLPFGMELNGNIGYRIVKTSVTGTGAVSFRSIQVTDNYDAKNPGAAAGIKTTVYRTNTSLTKDTTDFLPVYNVGLWLVPDKLQLRYNAAKTIARPPMSRLLPNGICTYDERNLAENMDADALNYDEDGLDMSCGSTFGNPALKPYTNRNTNLSLEWYVNKDTSLSASTFKQAGRIGAPNMSVRYDGVRVFDGSNAVDPATSTPLSNLAFGFSQYENASASTRRGVEFGGRTAFSFLPSYLKYTGMNANFTKQKGFQAAPTLELYSGDVMPVRGEPRYSYNASLWYDDGSLKASIALQVVAARFQCISPCGENVKDLIVQNYPAENASNWKFPYNPGLPFYNDATRYIDAKIAYTFKNGIEIFLEGRNLGMSAQTNSVGAYDQYASGAPSLYISNFNGRRIMAGINFRAKQ